MKNQIFISYRRNGGEAMAQLLYDRLKNLGYEVFYDIESLDSGLFNKKLYNQIEECDDFLLILPPQALDRCLYEEDWVRREIRHALKHKKNIIPIIMRGFVFPHNLPKDIAAVTDHQGVEFDNMGYIDAKMNKITSMLKSKPQNRPSLPASESEPSLIRNVCSLGSCDFDNPFPTDAHFSEVVDRDKYNIIRFHITTAPINDKATISASITIFDSNNNIVYNKVSDFDWKPSFNLLSLSWIIRNHDGSFVKSDKYRAEFRIENSSIYEYYFTIITENDSKLLRHTNENDTVDKNSRINQTGISNITEVPPKGLVLYIVTSILAMIALTAISSARTPAGAYLLLIPLAIFYVKLLKFTRQHVVRSRFISFFLCTLLYLYYGAYLLLAFIAHLISRLRHHLRK